MLEVSHSVLQLYGIKKRDDFSTPHLLKLISIRKSLKIYIRMIRVLNRGDVDKSTADTFNIRDGYHDKLLSVCTAHLFFTAEIGANQEHRVDVRQWSFSPGRPQELDIDIGQGFDPGESITNQKKNPKNTQNTSTMVTKSLQFSIFLQSSREGHVSQVQYGALN